MRQMNCWRREVGGGGDRRFVGLGFGLGAGLEWCGVNAAYPASAAPGLEIGAFLWLDSE